MSAEPRTTDELLAALEALGGAVSEEDGDWFVDYESFGRSRRHLLDADTHDDALFEAWHYLKA